MNTLDLCDHIVNQLDSHHVNTDESLKLCDEIVVKVEFRRTYIGSLVSQGYKVRLDCVTLCEE